MKRIVLFSSPSRKNFKTILSLIFPTQLHKKKLAYMSPKGKNEPVEYYSIWKGYANKLNTEFRLIDVTQIDFSKEREKLLNSNILLITGGNTFELLYNLRKSELDKTILDFIRKDEYIIAGWSAGAEILTPSINTAARPGGGDKNLIGLKNFKALNIVNFTIWPHYQKDQKEELEKFHLKFPYKIKSLTDDDYIIIDTDKH